MSEPKVTVSPQYLLGWMRQAIENLDVMRFDDADDTVLAVRAHLLEHWALAEAQGATVVPGFEAHTQSALDVLREIRPEVSASGVKLADILHMENRREPLVKLRDGDFA